MNNSALRRKVIFDVSYAVFVKAVVVVLLLLFLFFVRDLLLLIFIALVVAAAINPIVTKCSRFKIPRSLTVLMIYVVLIGLLVLTVSLLVPAFVEEGVQLLEVLPIYFDQYSHYFGIDDISIRSEDIINSLQKGTESNVGNIFETVIGFFGGVVSVIVVFVLSFYFVVQENALRKVVRMLVPLRHRKYAANLVSRIQESLGRWLVGQMFLCLVIGTLVYIGLTIMGVKYALVLAILAGLLELVPYIGPISAAIPSVLLALVDSPVKAILVVAVYIIIQQFENHVIVPKIMSKAVGINPVLILIGVLFGAKLAGVAGIILAVPVVSILNLIMNDYLKEREFQELNNKKQHETG